MLRLSSTDYAESVIREVPGTNEPYDFEKADQESIQRTIKSISKKSLLFSALQHPNSKNNPHS